MFSEIKTIYIPKGSLTSGKNEFCQNPTYRCLIDNQHFNKADGFQHIIQ